MKRKKFLETSGRWFSAILLSWLGGYLIWEREITSPAICSEHPFCQQCLKFKGCNKPQAKTFQNPESEAGN